MEIADNSSIGQATDATFARSSRAQSAKISGSAVRHSSPLRKVINHAQARSLPGSPLVARNAQRLRSHDSKTGHNRLPTIKQWPVPRTVTAKQYKFLEFIGDVQKGQLFGLGRFEDGADLGIWRNRYLIFLSTRLRHHSKITEILRHMSRDFLPCPKASKPKVFDRMGLEAPLNFSVQADTRIGSEGDDNILDISQNSGISLGSGSKKVEEPVKLGFYTEQSLSFLENVETENIEEVMNSLEERIIDVNVADSNGVTGLILASATTFNPKLVSLLLNHGSNILQSMLTPEPFTSLRLALNILYHKKLNFKKIFTRLNRPDDVNFFDAEVPEKKKTTSTASASSRRKKAKLTKEKAHLEATLEAIAEGENGVPACFLLTKKQKRKLKEIIHILIRRGAVITKFCLAVAVISCDVDLLEYMLENGNLESTKEYTDYLIKTSHLSILHLAVLSETFSEEMASLLTKHLPDLDVNQRIHSDPLEPGMTEPDALTPEELERREREKSRNQSSKHGSKASTMKLSAHTSRAGSRNKTTSKMGDLTSLMGSVDLGFESGSEASSAGHRVPFYHGWRPVDCSVMKKNTDRALVKTLAAKSDSEKLCPIRKGSRILAHINHTQLAMAVHGTRLVGYIFDDIRQLQQTPSIDMVCDVINIQAAPLRNVGDADKRLAIIDRLISQSEGKIGITQPLPPQKYPSKTVVDFAYFQFLQFAKSRVALASLDKTERQALNENKVLLRSLASRYRHADSAPPEDISWCYECCRSNFVGSHGRIEQLKKFLKPTKLEKAPYFCSSYCKARLIDNLKNGDLLVNPGKTIRTRKTTEEVTDELGAFNLVNNTPGLGPMDMEMAKSLGLGSPSKHTGFNGDLSLQQQVQEYQRKNKLGIHKPVSILSLRNANFTLPNPVSATDMFGQSRLLAGVNQSKENYSYI